MTIGHATCCLALAGACVVGAAAASPATRPLAPEVSSALLPKQPGTVAREGVQSTPSAPQGLIMPAVPRGVRLQRVLSDASINGQAATVWTFSSIEHPDKLTLNIIEHWHATDRLATRLPAPRLDEQGGWLIASRVLAGGLEVVQVQAHPDGASGFWTVWSSKPPARSADAALAALFPGSVRIVNRLASNDAGGRSASVVAESFESVGSLAQAFALRALAAGLHATPAPGADSRSTSKPSNPHLSSRQLRFAAPGRELLLTLERDDARTVVVAHWLETTP